MGTKNSPSKFDCYEKALPDEPLFVLLARDPYAPYLLDCWANLRQQEIEEGERPKEDEEAVLEAKRCAQDMRSWRKANDGRWRQQQD